jgi:light-regulated signal transduction histidine kinase (bacteriophytochrome)
MLAVRDDEGKIIGLTMAATDITQRKNIEEDIKALNESLELKVKERTAELENSNKELEAFGYSVSHDLRAPLRIINGYGQLLINDCADKLNEEENECLQVIMNSTTRMGQLIDDLLNLSHLGRAALMKKRVNMNDLVKEVIGELKAGDHCTAEIILNELPCSDCDPNLTKQVWTNLISNAIKYSRKSDHPHIEIGIQDHNGSHAYYVKDNGAGFEMKFAGKLFEVFQRLHHTSEYEGTGVGLAITHRIISKHGGKIWAEAKVDEGATFYFTLPETKDLN